MSRFVNRFFVCHKWQVNLLGCSSKTSEEILIFLEHCLEQKSLCHGCKTCSSCWRGGTTITSCLVRFLPNCSMWKSSHRLWRWSLVKGFEEQIWIRLYSNAAPSKLPVSQIYFQEGCPWQFRSCWMCFPLCIAPFDCLDMFCRCGLVLIPSWSSSHFLGLR